MSRTGSSSFPNRLIIPYYFCLGAYLFSSAPSGAAGGAIYNLTQLVPGILFEIRIPNGQAPLTGLNPTAVNTAGTGVGDARDSDGVTIGSNVVAAGTISEVPGTNNHTFDFGFSPLLTTAAELTVAGRVVDKNNRAISRAIVQLQNAETGEVRIAQTNSRGDYRFEGIDSNTFLIITISKTGYNFTPSQQTMSLTESADDVQFVGSRTGKGGGAAGALR